MPHPTNFLSFLDRKKSLLQLWSIGFFFLYFLVHGYLADKEKQYSRQYSAPILKRKSSRFGMGQCVASVPNNPPNLSSQLQPGSHSLCVPCTNLCSTPLPPSTDSFLPCSRVADQFITPSSVFPCRNLKC